MSRTMIAFAIILSLLTGGVVGQLVAMSSPGVAPYAIASTRRLELTRSFYDGMNRYLETGDAGFLSLLAPGFQDVEALSDDPGSADSLMAQLDALRASTALEAFEIDEIRDLGQLVLVRLSTGLPPELEAGGFTLSGMQGDGMLEFLKVQGNAIVARWGQGDLIPRTASSLSERFAIPTPPALKIEGDLVTLDRGAEWLPNRAGASWLIVEQGEISVSVGSEVETFVEHEARSSGKGMHRIANRAEGASSFWLFSIANDFSSTPVISSDDALETAGVTIERRVRSRFIGLPRDLEQIQIDVSRIVAPPGVNLDPATDALGYQIVVIDGSVDAVVHNGELIHITESESAVTVRDRVSIDSHTAAAALARDSASYRVNSPGGADLLLVTIERVA